jgi:hypothetical protein
MKRDLLAVASCVLLLSCFIFGLIWFWYATVWAEITCISSTILLTACMPFMKILEN